ncbi:MAG: hypothetical protein QXT28_09100 [Thermofilaceae archaeon]
MIIESALLALALFFFILGALHGSDVVEDSRGNRTQQAPVLKPLILLSAAVVFFTLLNIPLSAVLASAASSRPIVTVHAGPSAANITITYGEPASEQGPPLVSPYYAVIAAITALAPPAMYYAGYVLGDYIAAEEKTSWKPPVLLQRRAVYALEAEPERPAPIVVERKEVVYLDELV